MVKPGVQNMGKPATPYVMVGSFTKPGVTAAAWGKAKSVTELANLYCSEERIIGAPVFVWTNTANRGVLPDFTYRDTKGKYLKFDDFEFLAGIDVMEEICHMLVAVDIAEQNYTTSYNMALILYSARWVLWEDLLVGA